MCSDKAMKSTFVFYNKNLCSICRTTDEAIQRHMEPITGEVKNRVAGIVHSTDLPRVYLEDVAAESTDAWETLDHMGERPGVDLREARETLFELMDDAEEGIPTPYEA